MQMSFEELAYEIVSRLPLWNDKSALLSCSYAVECIAHGEVHLPVCVECDDSLS